jgi:hypothetical protein
VVPDVATGFAWGARAGHLLGAQHQDLLEHLVTDLVDHGLDYLAGILDQVDDGSRICPLVWQNCSITAADSRARVTMW